jgi:hypothetical protein
VGEDVGGSNGGETKWHGELGGRAGFEGRLMMHDDSFEHSDVEFCLYVGLIQWVFYFGVEMGLLLED